MIGEDFIGIAAAVGTAGMTAIGIISGIYNVMVSEVGTIPALILGTMGAFIFVILVLGIYNNTKINKISGGEA
jgi:hypothetical protein